MAHEAGQPLVPPLGRPLERSSGLLSSQRRAVVQAVLDAMAWFVAVPAAMRRPLSLTVDTTPWSSVLTTVGLCIMAAVAIGVAAGLYTARWPYGSFEEVQTLVGTALLTGVAVLVVDRVLLDASVPAGSLVVAPVFALLLMCGTRYVWRLWTERSHRPDGQKATRVVVFGAGGAGRQIITSMLATPHSEYVPVALLDDNPLLRRRRIKGLTVSGGRYDMAQVALQHRAGTLLIAVPSASGRLIRELTRLAERAQLDVVVLPGVNQLVGGRVHVDDIRAVTPDDLLGRATVDTDVSSVAGYLTGRRVLVTGAGGSIGSELCRQITAFSPAELVMLDRDESALHGVQLSIDGTALLDTPNLVVADIRDRERLEEVFRRHRPQVVFHAAALKHLPLLEMHPSEALKTNVWGTLNVLAAAEEASVETFVNISTDKAADPVSVLGYSKRIAERLTADAARRTSSNYLSVRFGNVVGSRGSVLLTFRAQIASGGPVTVTDRDVTRFFMTVEEAVQLVVQAGALGDAGEVLVLDMGQPVSIADLARRLVQMSGRDVDIEYTGLRHGEKMHEQLVAVRESVSRSKHPLILQTCASPLRPEDVLGIHPGEPDLVGVLARLCDDAFSPAGATGASGGGA